MKQPCGCCAGIEIVTPEPVANRPGLPALALSRRHVRHLSGKHAGAALDAIPRRARPGRRRDVQRVFPLAGLVLKNGTLHGRAPASAPGSRRSVDCAARCLGRGRRRADLLSGAYRQRRVSADRDRTPLGSGTGASGRLPAAARHLVERLPGFTVNAGFNGLVPAGTRAQSLPAAGQKPQAFETSDDLPARDVWNNLKPRFTRPQVITLVGDPDTGGQIPIDHGTDASTRDTLYFDGVSTNLKAGDALLIVAGEGDGEQLVRFVESVSVQEKQSGTDPQDKVSRTEVTLQMPLPDVAFGAGNRRCSPSRRCTRRSIPFIDDASSIFSGGELAAEVADILQKALADASALAQAVPVTATASDVASLLLPAIPELQDRHGIAVRRGFTRLEPWIADVIVVWRSLLEQLPHSRRRGGCADCPNADHRRRGARAAVHRPSGRHPRSARARALAPAGERLPSDATGAAGVHAGVRYRPAPARGLQAGGGQDALQGVGGNIQPRQPMIQVYALRVKAAPFGNNAPLKPVITDGTLKDPVEWDFSERPTRTARSSTSTRSTTRSCRQLGRISTAPTGCSAVRFPVRGGHKGRPDFARRLRDGGQEPRG